MCQIACPFGAVGYSASERKIVKCDLCGGEPECVTFCPWQAITLIEADDAVLAKRRAFGARLKEAMKEVKV
jgi:Fe-S-cluster-containing hydrogenase component 2